VVLAGAGSGKTRTLIHRVARLLAAGVAPRAIVLCTFTQRAARELVERLRALSGAAASGVRAGTIHHLAHRILDEHGGFGRYRILDRGDADRLLAEALAGQAKPQPVRALYGRALAEQRTLAEVVARRSPRLAPQVAALETALDDYARRKAAARALDFDDLLFFCKMLLTEKRPSLGIEHVLVDEYQDVTRLQAELLALLGGTPFVVGDPAQAIYSFRGADPKNLTDFANINPTSQILTLSVNYRSTPEVIAAANKIGRRQLRATAPAGPRPARVDVDDERQQALFVAARMGELIEGGTKPSELAALYRTHAHGLALERELARRRLPYRMRSGSRFAELPHIQEAVAWLRRRPELPPAERLAELEPPDDEAAAEDLRALARMAAEASSTDRLLDELALHGHENAADAVTLSTVHQAKGLEWKAVFVLSLVEGRFPLPARHPEDLDEERRLFYVAVTRAAEQLYLCRPHHEGETPLTPSRYLLELDGLTDRWSVVS
jgi:ATP-dependent DNA helicase UvrD/PcrA